MSTFHNLAFLDAPRRVFTPRPATEALVDRAVELIGGRGARVADVGTGSGAIAVTLALLAPRAEVWATDVNTRAAALARRNAARHGLGGRMHVLEGDLLDPIPPPLDLVVANLPYLPARLAGTRAYEDLGSEPADAVFAPGDGLDPYRRLLLAAESKLVPDGRVLVQLHRQIFEAGRVELPSLRARLADIALPFAA